MDKRSKRYFLLFASSLPAVLFLLLPFYRPAQLPVVLLFLGRFHPVLLHFPIVLIMMALLFELAGRLRYLKKSYRVVRVVLVVAVISTAVAVSAGFFLFASGDYSGELMEQHFWAGSITGAAIVATTSLFFLYQATGRFYHLYFTALIASNLSVTYASHLGGTITHGKDFLTEYIPVITGPSGQELEKTPEQMLVYADLLHPIFEFKCASCHNSARAKGDFVITSYRDLMKGGEGGLSVVSGSADSSELVHRILLPESHEDHMPPEGKAPMQPDEIAVLKFWIQSGATEALTVSEARRSSEMRLAINRTLPALARYGRKVAISRLRTNELQLELKEIARQLSISIQRDSARQDDYFTVAMNFPPSSFTNDQLKELMPYRDNFSKVSLASSGIADDGLYYLGQMTNVRELYLQKTRLDGSGLVYLQHLPHLEILNLSFTNVDDKASIDLLKIPSLREVYLYRTKTSPGVLEALRKNRPGLKIVAEEGPYF